MWWELTSLFLQPYATAGFPCLLPQNERIEEFLSFLLRLFGLQVGLVDLVCWWRSRSRNVLRAEKKPIEIKPGAPTKAPWYGILPTSLHLQV